MLPNLHLRPLSLTPELTAHMSCAAYITAEKASINTEQNKPSLSFLVCIVNTAAQNFHIRQDHEPLNFLILAVFRAFIRQYDVF